MGAAAIERGGDAPDGGTGARPRRPAARSRASVATRAASDAERRLEALHRRTGVLAHDFNNLLNVIVAASEALAAQAPEGSDARELAQISLEAAERGAGLLERIAELTRPAPFNGMSVDCAEVLVSVTRLANVSTPEAVTVVACAMTEPVKVCADRQELEAAVLNLCLNAGHAMPDGGAIQVSAAPAEVRGERARNLGLAAGAYVAIAVRDPGVGMSPDVLARCMEPYFTTRAGRGGTGLGLAGVKAFAVNAGGGLHIISAKGRGATATIYLPRA